jgi:hypothetical protein
LEVASSDQQGHVGAFYGQLADRFRVRPVRCVAKDGCLMAAMEAIATTYLEADAASVTFSSIPQTFQHLQLSMSLKSAYASSGGDYLYVRFNSETSSANQAEMILISNGASLSVLNASGHMQTRRIPAALDNAVMYGSVQVTIIDYANANKRHNLLIRSGSLEPTRATIGGGMVTNTNDAVDTIQIIAPNGSLVRGSVLTLYGLDDA